MLLQTSFFLSSTTPMIENMRIPAAPAIIHLAIPAEVDQIVTDSVILTVIIFVLKKLSGIHRAARSRGGNMSPRLMIIFGTKTRST